MMKIAILGPRGSFDKGSGSGVRRYLYELYSNMSLYAGKDIELDKIEVPEELPFLGRRMPFLAFMLNNLTKAYAGYDIVHNPSGDLLCLPLKDRNTLQVNTAHEFSAIKYPEFVMERYLSAKKQAGVRAYYRLLKAAEKASLKADYLIADSTLTREDAVSLGYDRKRICVVSLGIDSRFLSAYAHRRMRKGFVVGSIGSYIYKKNRIFGVKAVKLLEDKDVHMELWGKRSDTKAYADIEKEASSDRRIHLMGFAPEDRLVRIYDSFDVYVHPVLYAGFELEILEAQARGIPVIVYRKGRIAREVRRHCIEVESEEEMAEKIKELKENGYGEKKRKAAMNYARGFTWEKTALNTILAYEKMISSGRQ